jgi:hypothetical protein
VRADDPTRVGSARTAGRRRSFRTSYTFAFLSVPFTVPSPTPPSDYSRRAVIDAADRVIL